MGGPGEKYVVESNVSGQLQALIASRFAWKPPRGHVRRYDGRPINAPPYILDWLEGGGARD